MNTKQNKKHQLNKKKTTKRSTPKKLNRHTKSHQRSFFLQYLFVNCIFIWQQDLAMDDKHYVDFFFAACCFFSSLLIFGWFIIKIEKPMKNHYGIVYMFIVTREPYLRTSNARAHRTIIHTPSIKNKTTERKHTAKKNILFHALFFFHWIV